MWTLVVDKVKREDEVQKKGHQVSKLLHRSIEVRRDQKKTSKRRTDENREPPGQPPGRNRGYRQPRQDPKQKTRDENLDSRSHSHCIRNWLPIRVP